MTSVTRIYFLDNLKVFLIMLVVAHHAGQPYGGSEGWWYFKTIDSPGLGAFFAVNAAFFMGLFFLISAYFVPSSLDKNSVRGFIKKRLVRLGIPLVIGFLLLIPFSLPEINFGHLWFLQHLLIYSVLYAVFSSASRRIGRVRKDNVDRPFPSQFLIVFCTLIVALLTFLIRIKYPIDHWIGFLGIIQTEFAHVPQYVFFFIFGIIAARNNWFNRVPTYIGVTWMVIGVVLALVLYSGEITAFQTGGLNWGSLGYSITEMYLCTGLCIGLIYLFHRLANKTNALLSSFSFNTYSIYIFHVPIVVSLQYAVEQIPVSAYIRFAIVIMLGISLSFLFSQYVIRKLPVLGKVF
ncbi:MAG: acyltransferase family protein [Candidatus Cohnella colombiensis]|uniref:Acyltransferase family protein n=1 Tax=Candidatus Cohnella colombiensis TaxID=3121368 RepID=A0AA95EYV4_9BACL|nr:MAG: acyltransferase family protein [Cohnella sp.]